MNTIIPTDRQTDILEHVFALSLFEELIQNKNRVDLLKGMLAYVTSEYLEEDEEVNSYLKDLKEMPTQEDRANACFTAAYKAVNNAHTDDEICEAFQRVVCKIALNYRLAAHDADPHSLNYEDILKNLGSKRGLYLHQFLEDCDPHSELPNSFGPIITDNPHIDIEKYAALVLSQIADDLHFAMHPLAFEKSLESKQEQFLDAFIDADTPDKEQTLHMRLYEHVVAPFPFITHELAVQSLQNRPEKRYKTSNHFGEKLHQVLALLYQDLENKK